MKLEKSSPKAPPARDFGRVIRNLPPAMIFGFYMWLLMRNPLTTRWLDFPVYWDAGKKALLGASVYDVAGHFQYKYSPLVALLFGKIFQSMSFESASWAFQKTMLFLWLALFLKFSRRNFKQLLLGLFFFGNALLLDLELGQINALVLLLLSLLFTSLEQESSWKRDLLFALFFSLAIQLKLFCLILIPLLLIQREWRKLALGFLFLPLLSIGGVAASHGLGFALSENVEWIKSLTQSTDELILSDQNVGLLGSGGKILGLFLGKSLWFIFALIFFAYLIRNRGRSIEWFRNRLLYAVAVFNPLVWSYWILFAAALFFERVRDLSFPQDYRYRVLLVLGGIFTLAAFNGQHARWAWNGGIFFGLVWVVIMRFLSDRPAVSPPVRNKLEAVNVQ